MVLAVEADEEALFDEDKEDDEILPGDALLVVASTDEDYSHLEVQLLSDDGNLYTHHDITLKEFPLCLAWLDCPPFLSNGMQVSVGNYVAVGTFDPSIEIWNLDVLDPLEPTATLGGYSNETIVTTTTALGKNKKNKKNKKVKKLYDGSHSEGVLTLDWNHNYRQALVSGSADHTVKIWDVTVQKCLHTFTHHKDKVRYHHHHHNYSYQIFMLFIPNIVTYIELLMN